MKTYLLSLACLSIFIFNVNDSHAVTADGNEENTIQRVRISFTSPSGNVRQLLLGFTSNDAATDNFDYGYDAKNPDNFPNDMSWMIDNEKYVIQGVGKYSDSKRYELGIHLDETGMTTLELIGLENFDTEIPVYIYDAMEDSYAPLNKESFQLDLEPGLYLNRFYVAFSNNSTLSIDDKALLEDTITYYKDQDNYLNIKFQNTTEIMSISVVSLDGRKIYNKLNVQADELSIPIYNLKSIPVIVLVKTESQSYTKKLVLN